MHRRRSQGRTGRSLRLNVEVALVSSRADAAAAVDVLPQVVSGLCFELRRHERQVSAIAALPQQTQRFAYGEIVEVVMWRCGWKICSAKREALSTDTIDRVAARKWLVADSPTLVPTRFWPTTFPEELHILLDRDDQPLLRIPLVGWESVSLLDGPYLESELARDWFNKFRGILCAEDQLAGGF
jgi:hypothetical protein